MHSADSPGSYFPSQPGVELEGEWPIGDEATWKTALKAQEVDPDDAQDVANSVVRHVTTSLARQAFNLDDVSADACPDTAGVLTPDCRVPGYSPLGPGPAPEAMERDHRVSPSIPLVQCGSQIRYHTARAPKRVYYLSIEWLLGRSLDNAVLNLGMRNTYEEASRKLGFVRCCSLHLSRPAYGRTLRTCLTKSEMPGWATAVSVVLPLVM